MSGPLEEELPLGRAVVEPEVEAIIEEVVEEAFEDIDVDAPVVGIVVGSKEEIPAIEDAENELTRRGILYELRVAHLHQEAEPASEYARNAKFRGLRVMIVAAGLGAALPGLIAAHTELPVIGVPLAGPGSVAGGLDAVLGIVQMPPGTPVACVSVGGAHNAAVLAARILDA